MDRKPTSGLRFQRLEDPVELSLQRLDVLAQLSHPALARLGKCRAVDAGAPSAKRGGR